ncbi:cytochrome b/b6 domain-containing protein [Crenobacter sp. SG2305]|uniref:cytochrome b/b6 domain-containing protein n=1 Tax=Crenobacter oryzisoli TaxID=3056844 RepID=UPI0025AA871E|nr:cytochrome b/b6 domain-containing protein [Crenobacter sp. SG2305]MDN0081585.1 cytochrome b/b6 domain-containing protein [Crenobacter sp. SG2305]
MMQGVRVWDAPTRLFHWSLVAGFAGMWYSGKQGGDLLQYHIWCGIGIAGLLLFRLLWGMVGSDTARFAHFVRGPGTIMRYLKGELAEHEQPGHNPLGALMVVALLGVLLFQVSTGLFSADVDSYLYDGPLAARIDSGLAEAITAWHKLSFNLLLGLVGLHVLAILIYKLVKKQNLVHAMVTGRKPLGGVAPRLRFASPVLAVLMALLSAGGVYLLLTRV